MGALDRSKVLVVGAGVSGLSAAVLAAERGASVELVEGEQAIGGLLQGHRFRDVDCDLGSHRLHRAALEHPVVARLVGRIDLRRRPRRGVLLLGGLRIPYPPSWLDLARGLSASGPRFAASFVLRRERLIGWERARLDDLDEDLGFSRFVRARVGDAAFEAFYRPYVEKVWGLDADQVSQTVAKARVSTTAPLSLIASGLGRRLARAFGREHRPGEFLYPRLGMSTLVEDLRARAEALGVVIRRGVRFDPRAPRQADVVLHSGKLADLTPRALGHRGVYLVYLALPLARVDRFETYYTPEARFWFGRVSELANYAPALSRPGETILCVEIPEGRWGEGRRFDRAPELRELLGQLRRAEILPPNVEPLEVSQRFVRDVYPLYVRGWAREWGAALDDVARLGGVLPFGRQGLYLHCNIDQCMAMALDVVDHVDAARSFEAWRAHARGVLLGVRVRD